ncbi:MBOAT family O-acyltransferase [Anaerovibrio lipolyticus]|uniref:MBOAT family O-acyltransferase n=1 Tax=Anaerovibrio lipolyticus TaxID=82374 RepID=UPI001E3EB1C7|nr:MBOAT family protein [Anaerovibrio lipolyticus]
MAFLPITCIVFFILGHQGKPQMATIWLVVASFFFYGWWDIRYVPLLFASITFNYMVGRKLEKSPGQKSWLICGIAVNLLLLGYFKYTDFFITTVNDIAGVNYFDLPHIVLPLGISFFTFTQTAYLVDAFRGEAKNESFITYCEFVTIFPHLIAGPIINHKEMIPQFISPITFKLDYENMAKGLTIFSLGLFKKVVIADNLAIWSNKAFSAIDALTLLEAWWGALSYSLQLYFDFSGYSEMAIGLGLMINLNFPINFNSPYKACSIIDFWRRWHMTLGLWVKNYLYIPMGGNRHGELMKMRNLLSSMLLIGLWHGAGWTFVIWGGIHGAALVINHQWRRLKYSLPQVINWLLTFICVVFLWVFFRAENVQDGWKFVTAMVNVSNIDASWVTLRKFLILCIAIGLMRYLPNTLDLMDKFHPSKKWAVIIAALLIYSVMQLDSYSEFLYFQF